MSDDSETISSDDVIYDPDNYHRDYYEKGLELYKDGKYEKAISMFDRVLTSYPDDEKALWGKAVSLFSTDRHEETLETFNKYLETSPEFEQGWHYKGTVLSKLGRYEEALVAFDK